MPQRELADGTIVDFTQEEIDELAVENAAEETRLWALEVQRITNERRERLATLTVEMDGVTYDADAEGRENLNGIIAAISNGVPVAEPVNWRDHDNVTQTLSHAELNQLAGLMITAVQAIYETSWLLKAQVENSTDLASAQAITWT